MRLTDGQFKELMSIVDPTHSNDISYHKFLDLFEPKEDPVEGHKWLKSVHKFNDVQKPAVLAWETVSCVLDASMLLSPVKRRDMGLSVSVCPSVSLSVCPSVRPSPLDMG